MLDAVPDRKDVPVQRTDPVSRRLAAGARDLAALVRANIRLIIVAVAAVVVLWMVSELGEGEIMRIDALAYSFFVETLRSDALTPAVEAITSLASPVTVVAMLAVAAALAPGRSPGIAMALNLGGALVINQLLKFIVQRPRPEGFRLVDESGYSFPSGHSMVAMAFYGFLIYLVWHYERDCVERWLWCVCLAFIIAGIGMSRIYLGVHYASDVVAGFLVSLAWLAVFTKLACPLLLPRRDGPGLSESAGARTQG